MRTRIHPGSVQLWLSANDTYHWATRPDASWPCSWYSGKRFFAAYDIHGILELTVNGRSQVDEGGSAELNAIVADHLADVLPTDHDCRFITVDQFRQ